MIRSRNKVRRYRLSDDVAKKLGLKLNKNKRYRLSREEEDRLIDLKKKSNKTKILFIDIETSPNVAYSWRVGYNLSITPDSIVQERRIICVSYKWHGDNKVHTVHWDKDQSDKCILEHIVPVLNEADLIVGHNGDRFDMKWLRTRAAFHRVPMRARYKTVDTLKKAKASFYFNSNRLDYIAKFFGVGAKLEHSGFQMWKDVMAGDPKAMKEMVEYCEMDVIVLEDVYLAMEKYIIPNTHAGVISGKAVSSCPSCGGEHITLLKNEVTARGTVSRLVECQSCEMSYPISNRAYNRYLLDNQ